MKEFDYKKAKAGAPVCTRNGMPARIVCLDAKGEELPILALVTSEDDIEYAMWYTIDGKATQGDVYDLMMPTLKYDGWVNIFKRETSRNDFDIGGPIFPDDETAKNNVFHPDKHYNYITTIHIEWEE